MLLFYRLFFSSPSFSLPVRRRLKSRLFQKIRRKGQRREASTADMVTVLVIRPTAVTMADSIRDSTAVTTAIRSMGVMVDMATEVMDMDFTKRY